MLENFQRAIPLVLAHEGGFVDDRFDPGGATNLGVTIGTAKAIGLDVNGDGVTDVIDIKLLKPADAAKVYKRFYWDAVCGDLLPSGVDYSVFDFAVNSGVSRAAKHLQAAIGAYPDGHIGPKTLAALELYPAKDIIRRVNEDRLAFLKSLPTFGRYGRGWSARVKAVWDTSVQWAR